MKLLQTTIVAAMAIISFSTFGQLKVDQYGRIGMGTNWPNSGYKCHIKGNMLLTTYPDYPFIEFQFKVGNGWPGTEIGSTVDKIAFWSSYVGYHKLYSEQYYKMSDASFKFQSTQIVSPMSKILMLKPYKYFYKSNYITDNGDSLTENIPQYGFISQEVEQTLPEIKITEDGKDGKLMDYDQIIPLLVAGMQEQQKMIKGLEAQVARLIATNPNYNSNSGGNGNGNGNNPIDKSKLFSNSPNPFSASTNLNYYLSANTTQAEIRIYDMQGVERKIFNLNPNQGNSFVVLSGSDLPLSGTYIFALFTESQIVDAKKIVKQ